VAEKGTWIVSELLLQAEDVPTSHPLQAISRALANFDGAATPFICSVVCCSLARSSTLGPHRLPDFLLLILVLRVGTEQVVMPGDFPRVARLVFGGGIGVDEVVRLDRNFFASFQLEANNPPAQNRDHSAATDRSSPVGPDQAARPGRLC
jgi:hypothetical protein